MITGVPVIIGVSRPGDHLKLSPPSGATANTGLAWKTLLTVFLPPVDGWFLVNDKVGKGFRYFAIGWCCFMALDIGLAGISQGPGVAALCALLCLAPVGAYLFRKKDELLARDNAYGKIPFDAFAFVLAISLFSAYTHTPVAPSVDTPDISPDDICTVFI